MIPVRRRVLPMTGFILAMTLVFAAFLQVSIPTTSAAWTDRTVVKGTVTAAPAWLPPFTGNKCLAYSSPTATPIPCTITRISFQKSTDTSGHFYIDTNAPGGTHHVYVDVDLKTATGLPPSWTSWINAGVLQAGNQIIPSAGWTCSSLPRIVGMGTDWILTNIQVPVTLQRGAAMNTICR